MTVDSASGGLDRLGVTLLFSIVAHAVLALGLTFEFEKPAPQLPSIDVILVQSANSDKPDKADFIAKLLQIEEQANLAGAELAPGLLRSRLQHMAVLAKTLRGRLEGAVEIVRVERGAPPAVAGDKPLA